MTKLEIDMCIYRIFQKCKNLSRNNFFKNEDVVKQLFVLIEQLSKKLFFSMIADQSHLYQVCESGRADPGC